MGFHEMVRPWYRDETMTAAVFFGFWKTFGEEDVYENMLFLGKIKEVFKMNLGVLWAGS
jgi:hypothetical protein